MLFRPAESLRNETSACMTMKSMELKLYDTLAREKRSYTGHYLKDVLRRGKKEAAE